MLVMVNSIQIHGNLVMNIFVVEWTKKRRSVKTLILLVDTCYMAMATVAGLINQSLHTFSRMAGLG